MIRPYCHRCMLQALLLLILIFAPLADARTLSLQEAIERVQRDTNGKVLSAETVTKGQQTLYRIKVLTPEGQVRVIQVSADQ